MVAVLPTAILDRLLHHSYVLNNKGRTYRLGDIEHALGLRQCSGPWLCHDIGA